MEDMFPITKAGAELLRPGVLYSVAEIEAAMRLGANQKQPSTQEERLEDRSSI